MSTQQILSTTESDTGRQQTNQHLRASELSYRRLFETSPDGILILDANTGCITDVNPFLTQLLGFSHGEMVGKTVGELSPFKSLMSNPVILERLQHERYVRYEDLPLETRDGRKIAVEFISNVYQVGDQQVIQCDIRDITNRKQSVELLRVSEERYHSLFENMLDGLAYCQMIFEQDQPVDFIYREVNKAFETLTGWKNVVNKKVTEIIPGIRESSPIIFEVYGRVSMSGQSERFELYLDQLKMWLAISVYSTKKGYFVAVFKNITAAKLAATALLESKRFLLSALDALSTQIAILDENGAIISVNAAWESFASENKFMGSQCGLGANYLQVCDSASDKFSKEAPIAASGIRDIIAGKRDIFILEYPCHDQQEKYWFILRVTRFGGDGPVRVVIAHDDISERKRTEARFSWLVDSNAQGVMFWNKKGQVTEANDSFLHLTGYTRADLLAGQINWMTMTPPKYVSLDQLALKELTTTGVCKPYEKEFIRKDGTRVPALIGAATFEDNQDEGVCFIVDLTERKKLENEFRQTQKMESIGTLAGGVAHDFNNILAVIQMQAELLKTSTDPAEQLEFANEIGTTVQRAAALTRQLLLFSSRETLQPRNLDLSTSIANVIKMLQRILGENIQVDIKLAPKPMFIHADAGMMDQVLLNLVVNARDAMPQGGQMIIQTSAVEFDEFAVSQSILARTGSFVCLTVSDSGIGIPTEILTKIFDPFFTTKGVGKGTGLGLATVYGIVQQHQGWINVYSEVGHGTTFRVYLPRLDKGSDTTFISSTQTTVRGGTETILLVEDDPSLRASVRMALSRLGYRILEAPTGVKALEVWKDNSDEISLLLTDLMMPDGMTGKELAQRIHQQSPKLKVIYMSGYSADVVGKDFPLEDGVNFLTKPFQGPKLAQTIRNSLDKSD